VSLMNRGRERPPEERAAMNVNWHGRAFWPDEKVWALNRTPNQNIAQGASHTTSTCLFVEGSLAFAEENTKLPTQSRSTASITRGFDVVTFML
jgi:hypothetical protein